MVMNGTSRFCYVPLKNTEFLFSKAVDLAEFQRQICQFSLCGAGSI